MIDPRILTDWEAHLADDDGLLNLYVELEGCTCEGVCVCEQNDPD